MKYTSFEIKNFKGIEELELNLSGKPQSKIFTLIGLNESGKTTILEAISLFAEDLKESELSLHGSNYSTESLIPKNKQDNFSDCIEISAKVVIEDIDNKNILESLENLKLIPVSIKLEIVITIKYRFNNSIFMNQYTNWDSEIKYKKSKRSTKIHIVNLEDDFFKKIKSYIISSLPDIIYYPNFLFEFPNKIYLESYKDETQVNFFYRELLQDVLDSLDRKLNIKEHIVFRARRAIEGSRNEKKNLRSVLNKIGTAITNTVFNENLKVFRRDISNKLIIIDEPELESNNEDEDERLYTRIQLRDGDDNYYIKERSLGFKWFFTFILFTQFRIRRKDTNKVIFLLDEPASNLHQTAQQRLLESLEKLTEHSASVIYTTHTHHLINPLWLESAFIVQNQALEYNSEESIDNYNSSMTNIKIQKYRSFVANSPKQRTYYQPILDKLEYRPSNLENIPNIIMVEGKNDFYTISYINDIILSKEIQLNFLPGMGSGGLDEAIKLYYAWGKNFIILLDSDEEGEKQKERYKNKFGKIIDNRLFTLENINDKWSNIEMEGIFSENEQKDIQNHKETGSAKFKLNKKLFNLYIQENLINKTEINISRETKENFKSILKFLDTKIKESQNLQ